MHLLIVLTLALVLTFPRDVSTLSMELSAKLFAPTHFRSKQFCEQFFSSVRNLDDDIKLYSRMSIECCTKSLNLRDGQISSSYLISCEVLLLIELSSFKLYNFEWRRLDRSRSNEIENIIKENVGSYNRNFWDLNLF